MFGQSAKGFPSMFITDFGIVMFCKDVQLNAPLPILVTESEIVILFKDVQQENASSPMHVTESGIVMFCKDIQK